MTEDPTEPSFREHLREMRHAVSGIGKDVATGVAESPRRAKEGTKNALARAAGIRRTPMREWSQPETDGK